MTRALACAAAENTRKFPLANAGGPTSRIKGHNDILHRGGYSAIFKLAGMLKPLKFQEIQFHGIALAVGFLMEI